MGPDENTKLDECLADALARIARGELTVDECLARHPEWIDELQPAILVSEELKASAFLPDPDFRAEARREFMIAAGAQAHRLRQQAAAPARVSRRESTGSWLARWMARFPRLPLAGASIALLIVLTGGAWSASGPSLPGSPLYTVKRTGEHVQLWTAPSPASEARLHVVIAEKRMQELRRLASSGKLDPATASYLVDTAASYDGLALAQIREVSDSLELAKVIGTSFGAQREILTAYAQDIPADSRGRLAAVVGE